MNKNKSCSIGEKIINIDYKKYAKFLLLIPVILIALGVMFTSIFGFNYSQQLQPRYEFVVDFGIELDNSKIEEYIEKVNVALENQELTQTGYKKIGQGIFTGLSFTIDSKISGLTEDKIQTIQEEIEKELQISIVDTVEVGELMFIHPDVLGFLVKLVLAILLALIAIFAYLWIRFDLKSAASGVLVSLMSTLSMIVVYGLFRLPFGYSALAIMLAATIISTFVCVYIYDNIRNTQLKNENLTNNEFVKEANNAVLKSFLPTMLYLAGFMFVLALVSLFFSVESFVTCIAFIFSIFFAIYFAMYAGTSLWTLIYNRANDQRLRNRIERLSKIEEKKAKKNNDNKEDEKLIV